MQVYKIERKEFPEGFTHPYQIYVELKQESEPDSQSATLAIQATIDRIYNMIRSTQGVTAYGWNARWYTLPHFVRVLYTVEAEKNIMSELLKMQSLFPSVAVFEIFDSIPNKNQGNP